MQKVTIGVYKSYKNSGNLRFPKANTKKHWKHYFIEIDEDDENDYSFGSEWVVLQMILVLLRKHIQKKS